MIKYPENIQNLINLIAKLPSIGPKTAERLVFYLIKQPTQELEKLSWAIGQLRDNIKICRECFNFSQNDPCPICADQQRNPQLICVVAKPQDILALEKTNSYFGRYHVLGGNINALENIQPENLKIKELLERIKKQNIQEVILAFDQNLTGETTTLYLIKLLKQIPNLKISRLARGLPLGADLEYADELTLENAISRRQEI